jgi:hypothetical protein
MFAQEAPPDFDVPGRRERGERQELVAEVGLVELACATGEVSPVDRSGHRPAGRRDDAARMADQPQAGGFTQSSH